MMMTADPEIARFVEEQLSSKFWRLNNLYTIKDKDNNEIILRLNSAQTKVLRDYKHPKKIILKSRQQGISTLFLAYNLDSCLFRPGYEAGIQSYGKRESTKLSARAKLMWDRFPGDIKGLMDIKLVKQNQDEMVFSNGSILKIGNFRGDTLQSLHVSELGKIAKKFPEKARELKAGAFQAIGKNNKITIESTAEGNTGLFHSMWETAYALERMQASLTPLDFQAIFLSWVNDPDCTMEEEPVVVPHKQYLVKELSTYFRDLEESLNIALTPNQKNWYLAKKIELDEMMKQEYPATPEEAFEQSVEGTYFAPQYQRLIASKRYTAKYTSALPVYTAWDLGMNDEMVILFAQLYEGQPRVIDEYHNSGEGIEYYIEILRRKPYKYATHFLPHDANVKELGTGRTRVETFRRLGINNIRVLRKLSFQDSIQAARQFIDIASFSNDTTKDTISAIQNYRKKYDDKLGMYLDKDVHNIHSNYAAALRYLAQGLSTYKLVSEVKKLRVNPTRRISSSDFAV